MIPNKRCDSKMVEPNNQRDQNAELALELSSAFCRNDDGDVLLGSELGNEAVVDLQNLFLHLLQEGGPLKIVANDVEYVGTAIVQLFYAAAVSARKTNAGFEITEPSIEVQTAFRDLGMDGLIRMEQIR